MDHWASPPGLLLELVRKNRSLPMDCAKLVGCKSGSAEYHLCRLVGRACLRRKLTQRKTKLRQGDLMTLRPWFQPYPQASPSFKSRNSFLFGFCFRQFHLGFYYLQPKESWKIEPAYFMLLLSLFLTLDSLFFIRLSLDDSIYTATTYILIMLQFKCLVQTSLIATDFLLDFSTWIFQR